MTTAGAIAEHCLALPAGIVPGSVASTGAQEAPDDALLDEALLSHRERAFGLSIAGSGATEMPRPEG